MEAKIFETTDVDLGAFLIFEGVKFLDLRIKDPRKNIVVMRFLDESFNCLDLERVFLNSECKKYRDINKYLLKKIHKFIRENRNGTI